MALPLSYGDTVSCQLAACTGVTESGAAGSGGQFSRCYSKLCALHPSDSESSKTEMNLLFDQLISENYTNNYGDNANISPADVCALLLQASRLVPFSQEHLVSKLCQLIHHLLNRLQVVCVCVCVSISLSVIIQKCKRSDLDQPNPCPVRTGFRGTVLIVILLFIIIFASPVTHLDILVWTQTASTGHRIDDYHGMKSLMDSFFERHLSQRTRFFFSQLLQNALKGMQCSLNGGKLKLGLDEQLGSLLAALKKYMFFGLPGMTLEIPAVLYPAPLPQYEGSPSSVKPEMPQDTHCTPRQTGNKRRKSRGRSRKAGLEGKRDEEAPEAGADPPKEGAGGGDPLGWGSQIPKNPGSLYRHAGQDHARPLYPLWKKMVSSSDSEFSDPEGSMQSKMRLYQAKVRQGALHCFLSTVKCVEKKVLYGYWSSFIPDAPGTGSPPSLTLLTIVLKDPSPKARAGALQVLSAMLEGSRQFLSAAEDTSAQRRAFTPFSATLAAGLRELHRCLLLALLAESSSQTLTQVIKCLATLVSNAPYSRLRPGLLSPLWRQIKPYIRHRVPSSCSSFALGTLGCCCLMRAGLRKSRLTVQDERICGSPRVFLPQQQEMSFIVKKGNVFFVRNRLIYRASLANLVLKQRRKCRRLHLQFFFAVLLFSSPQVLAHLVKGYFSIAQSSILQLGEVSAQCLKEADPSIQLHGAKLLEELGSGTIQQYKADSMLSTCPELYDIYWLCLVLNKSTSQRSLCLFILLSNNQLVQLVKSWTESCSLTGPAWPGLVSPGMCSRAVLLALSGALSGFSERPPVKQFRGFSVITTHQISAGSLSVPAQVKSNAVRALGNLLHFLQPQHVSRPSFAGPLEEAVRALIGTVGGDATMKVRWNACYALGNAFRNPALPLGTAPWTSDAYSALTGVVKSCKNFKVRIKSAMALAVPGSRERYGSDEQFGEVWAALALALERSEDTEDFLEYRYCASLRAQLCQALLHLLGLARPADLPRIRTSLAERGPAIRGYLARYHTGGGEGDDPGECPEPRERMRVLEGTLGHLRNLSGDDGPEGPLPSVVPFLEDIL
uniref:HEAT repeat-containing protein 6 n=1 Tax=Lepisosteus oculatus TaxID=7918 RepID=W5MFQ4_LEPOC